MIIDISSLFPEFWKAWGNRMVHESPVNLVQLQILLSLFWLFCAFVKNRQIRQRKKRIFFKSKRDTGKKLQLPDIKNDDDGNVKMSVLVSVVIVIILFTCCSETFCSIRMVSIARNKVNMRSGPGRHYRILWQLDTGYPLLVLGRKGAWYKVKDFEGDIGWVYRNLTSRNSFVVVKKNKVNIRLRPGTNYPVIAKAYKGVVLRTIASVKGWVKVRHKKGITGWVARRLVWGW